MMNQYNTIQYTKRCLHVDSNSVIEAYLPFEYDQDSKGNLRRMRMADRVCDNKFVGEDIVSSGETSEHLG